MTRRALTSTPGDTESGTMLSMGPKVALVPNEAVARYQAGWPQLRQVRVCPWRQLWKGEGEEGGNGPSGRKGGATGQRALGECWTFKGNKRDLTPVTACVDWAWSPTSE